MRDVPEITAMRRIRQVHFVGIGGAGMGGIAEVMINLGYRISGSDLVENSMTQRLRELGAQVFIGHDAEQLGAADAVVVSGAIASDNPEVMRARSTRVPVVPRAEMLAELMRFRYGIAVAGTHGKTTTTSLIATLLAAGNLDPTFVVGGKVNSVRSHARLGLGRYLVAEADESDASFLYLNPMISVVTNVDVDHMGTYGGDFHKLRRTFIEFLHHLPFYGLAVLCVDDPHLREIIPDLARPVLTYGIDEAADISAEDLVLDGQRSRFRVRLPQSSKLLPVTLNLCGRHNVLNALAAIAVALELGVAECAIQEALEKFEGIGRRFQNYGPVRCRDGYALLIDDYGHHPTEIETTLKAARAAYPERRLVLAFQPHRYTRTRDLFDAFSRVLNEADAVVLMDVYAASEPPIAGADSRTLCAALRARGKLSPVFVEEPMALAPALADLLRDGDLLMTMGAGSIGAAAALLPRHLAELCS